MRVIRDPETVPLPRPAMGEGIYTEEFESPTNHFERLAQLVEDSPSNSFHSDSAVRTREVPFFLVHLLFSGSIGF